MLRAGIVQAAGRTAPPHGLCLWNVDMDLMAECRNVPLDPEGDFIINYDTVYLTH